MGTSGSTPFPPSLAPETGIDATHAFDDERPSESGLHAAVPAVALLVADRALRDVLSSSMQGAGRVVGDDAIVPIAAVVITDAETGAKPTVVGLRRRTRSDATGGRPRTAQVASRRGRAASPLDCRWRPGGLGFARLERARVCAQAPSQSRDHRWRSPTTDPHAAASSYTRIRLRLPWPLPGPRRRRFAS